MSNTIEIRQLNINAILNGEPKPIVKGLNFSVANKEKLAIVGESGSGKTMTAMSIFGLLPQNCGAVGEISLEGRDILKMKESEIANLRGREMVFIPSGAEFLNPVLKVETQIFEVITRLGIKNAKQKKQIAIEKLTSVGLENPDKILKMFPFMLSGGMAQRVVIAITSVASPKLVIADELTKGIDKANADLIVKTLEETFSNSAIIIITHDISIARTCDKTMVMHNGEMVEFGKSIDILTKPFHYYTKSLISALPQNGLVVDRKINSIEETSKDGEKGEGCPFVNYCALATDTCQKHQEMKKIEGRLVRCGNV